MRHQRVDFGFEGEAAPKELVSIIRESNHAADHGGFEL